MVWRRPLNLGSITLKQEWYLGGGGTGVDLEERGRASLWWAGVCMVVGPVMVPIMAGCKGWLQLQLGVDDWIVIASCLLAALGVGSDAKVENLHSAQCWQ